MSTIDKSSDLKHGRHWWQAAVVYQVYPRSFFDSNGDGIGDLPGIAAKLDYIASLGADVVWLNPVYDSPNVDNGYDIADYHAIMTEFGTMADWEQLLGQMHARGLRMVMDLVVNHTSDRHAWFQEARRDPHGPYRDYYIWRPQGRKEDGGVGRAAESGPTAEKGPAAPEKGSPAPPNNWQSFFGGSAWQYDEAAEAFYLHLFAAEQPDLNWENPRLRREVYDLMRWWFDRGVDGFRMDVINLISKDPALPQDREPGAKYFPGSRYFLNGPRVHEYLQEMRREVLNEFDVVSVGECIGASPEDAPAFTNLDGTELDMMIHFEMMELDHGPGGKWDIRPLTPSALRDCVIRWQRAVDRRAWTANYLSNHDQPRAVSRFGDDGSYHRESATMLAVLNVCQQGTPFIHAGDEIGMTNVAFPSINDYRDVETLNFYRAGRARRENPDDLLQRIHVMSRDNGRTPMQWDATENAGFTTGAPWIGVNPNYPEINVANAEADPDSILNFYRRLLELRGSNRALVYGSFELRAAGRGTAEDQDGTFAFDRVYGDRRIIVLVNLTGRSAVGADVPSEAVRLVGNYPVGRERSLRPFEAQILEVPAAG